MLHRCYHSASIWFFDGSKYIFGLLKNPVLCKCDLFYNFFASIVILINYICEIKLGHYLLMNINLTVEHEMT